MARAIISPRAHWRDPDQVAFVIFRRTIVYGRKMPHAAGPDESLVILARTGEPSRLRSVCRPGAREAIVSLYSQALRTSGGGGANLRHG